MTIGFSKGTKLIPLANERVFNPNNKEDVRLLKERLKKLNQSLETTKMINFNSGNLNNNEKESEKVNKKGDE